MEVLANQAVEFQTSFHRWAMRGSLDVSGLRRNIWK